MRTGYGCVIGDFRHSGYLDIIFSGTADRRLFYFKGGENGYDFENPVYILMGPEKDKIEFWRVKGRAYELAERDTEELQRIGEFGSPRWMFTADLNNDGWLALILPQINGLRAYIYWGGSDGFSDENAQALAVDGTSAVNVADFNGNGWPDLVFAGFHSLGHSLGKEKGKAVIYWGSEKGYSENRKTYLPSYCESSLTIQDINGDGRLDLYATAYNDGRKRDTDSKMFFQGEDRMFHLADHKLNFNNSGSGCLSGDFNGDGYIDLAVASHKKDGSHVAESFVFWGGEDGIREERYTSLPTVGPRGMCTMDIGNVMDRSDSEYYYSEVYKTDAAAKKISWIAENGKKTWVKSQLRCADSVEGLDIAEWSESVENGADISALNLHGCIQYKLELGYDLLLEKPISPSLEECIAIRKAAEEKGVKVMVCHVLRYTPYFTALKTIIDSGKIGKIITMNHAEEVGILHQSHSFVRGNWGNEGRSTFMLLAKSCHDMDIMQWLVGKKVTKVQSFGGLEYFTEKNAPEGAPERCLDGCPVADTCIFNAKKLYLDPKDDDWFRPAAARKRNH